MNIVRRGSQRNRGPRTLVKGLVLKSRSGRPWSDSLAWNSESIEFVIQVRNVPSQDGKSHHDYTHRITLVDFAEMIDLAAHSGGKSSAKHLRTHYRERYSHSRNSWLAQRVLAIFAGNQKTESLSTLKMICSFSLTTSECASS